MLLLKIIKTFNQIFAGAVVIALILIGVRMANPVFLAGYDELNELPAVIATVLFIVVLLPGTFQRMGMTGPVTRFFVAWRRTLGIAMYAAALIHFFFLVDYLPWFSGGDVDAFDAVTASGFIAVVLLMPAILTSNNASVRFFKKHWKILQRVTYLTLPLIGIHLWQTGEEALAGIYIIATVFIMSSYFMKSASRGTSPISSIMSVIVVIIISALITFVTMRALFAAPLAKQREEQLFLDRDRVKVLQQELEESERLRLENQKIIDAIEAVKKAEQEAAAAKVEAARIAEEERLAALSDYKNGTYTANGSYVTDGGKLTESLDVTLTIKNDIIQSVRLVGHLVKTKSVKYHGKFERDIGGVIIGKNVNMISVHGIGGASDTSTGFRTALARIKAQATNK